LIPNGVKVKGILFIGGDGPPGRLCKNLASGAGLIAAADSGLIAAENAGIRPDWIIGDMDSLDDPLRLLSYPPERILRYPKDKDFTDTELALRFLHGEGCFSICIAGGGGGRIDHLFAIRSLFERESPPDRWLTAREDIYCVDSGQELFLPLKAGSLVSVFPLGSGPWEAASRGLKWPLNGLNWDRGFFGISNIAETGSFSVQVIRGRLMVIVPIIR
jgi:thiamine pyrophosphokinase